MADIGSIGSNIKLPIGQSPLTKNPQLNGEFQEIYNAIHILNGYLELLRDEFEGNDTNTPAENVPFRKKFKATALQSISVGAVVCCVDGGIVNGVLAPVTVVPNSAAFFNYAAPGGREAWGSLPRHYFIALTAASPGQQVEVGVGAGIIGVNGVTCGQTVWASDCQWLTYARGQINANSGQTFIAGRAFAGDGSMYLSNPLYTEVYLDAHALWEGIPQPGYPYRDGDWKYCGQRFLHPIGIAVANNYVMLRDFVHDANYFAPS